MNSTFEMKKNYKILYKSEEVVGLNRIYFKKIVYVVESENSITEMRDATTTGRRMSWNYRLSYRISLLLPLLNLVVVDIMTPC